MAKKNNYRVAVEWTMVGEIEVEADNIEEAKDKAYDMDLPSDGEYLDGSFSMNDDVTDELNEKED